MKNLFILTALFLISRLTLAQPVPTPEFPFKMTVEQYVEKFAPLAIEEMQRNRIPASITLAQGLLESGNGNSRLALQANNHFGIKCRKEWTGETLREDDDAPQECFRKYASPLDSYRDHSEFLMKGKRYAFLFDLELTDYKSWAKGLKSAGYATNPRYAEILITTIEKNNLQRFDVMKAPEAVAEVIQKEKEAEVKADVKLIINRIPATVVAAGESYASIAMVNDIKVWQLYKYNDLDKSANIKPGDTLYLKPKNYKGQIETVVVTVGDNLHSISQRYAIKESRLRKLNGLKEGQEPETGELLHLKSKRDGMPRLKVLPSIASEPDSVFDNRIYTDPKKNVETLKPELPRDPYDVEAHGVKEEMAFIHEVQPKETLFGISKKYNVQVDAIKALNKLNSNDIAIGLKLIINPNQPAAKPDVEAVVPGYHVVLSGETLYSISKLYNTTVEEIRSLNELVGDTIRVGEELIIVPLNGEQPREDKVTDEAEEEVYHLVKEKDTLYSISRKYRVSESQLRKMNNLLDNTIQIGQRLRVR